jgi:hypothetical protein
MARYTRNGTTNLANGPALVSAVFKPRDYDAEGGGAYGVFTPAGGGGQKVV